MSLRRKILIVTLIVNVLTLTGLAVYGMVYRARVLHRLDQQRQATRELLSEHLLYTVRQEIKDLEAAPSTNPVRPALRIRDLGFFEDPVARRLVRRAILVHIPPGQTAVSAAWFNLSRRYVFDDESLDREREAALALVESARRQGHVVDDGDRMALGIDVGGEPWGGLFLTLSDLASADGGTFDGQLAGPWPFLLIVVPGTLFLAWFVWSTLSRAVIRPFEQLSAMAYEVGRGDFSRRLPRSNQRDETGRVFRAVNRMLELIEDSRKVMVERDQKKSARIERQTQELMLAQRLAATGTLASGIAHEINNPLSGMLNATARLKREDLPSERRVRYLDVLEDGIERIAKVVSEVLSVSPRKVTPGPLFLPDVLERTVDLIGHRALARGVALRIGKPPQNLPLVLGESNEVGQVFLNLLINAIDASRNGGEVRVAFAATDDQVVVTVEDDGEGMSPEVAARAFDHFFTTKEAGKGTGLGLAIVHHLVQEHGGQIELNTNPGEGTRFFVRFPRLRMEDPADG